MKRNSNVVTLGGNPVTLLGKIVRSGNHAKNFIAVGQDFKPVKLSDYQGKVRIISSIPSVDTDVCAEQTRRFNLEASKLDNVQIITISTDLPTALKRFCAAEGIDKTIVVSDHRETDFGIKYGFLIEEFRQLARGVIIIDQYDMVKYVEIVKEIADQPDYDNAISVAKKLAF
ncbi:MAG: thiol peroxidase [Bacteroidetes bacterium]|nr:MAG: thiol peroxidase [Bacteroidota bacterium]